VHVIVAAITKSTCAYNVRVNVLSVRVCMCKRRTSCSRGHNRSRCRWGFGCTCPHRLSYHA
jgi:hypothetical protein